MLFEYSKTLVLAFLVVAATRNSEDLLAFLWSVVIGTGCLTYLAIFVLRVSAAHSSIARIAGGVGYDANDMLVVGLIGLVIALLVFQVTKSRGKIICVLVLLSIGMMIARSGSRGGFLGLVAVGGALLVMVKTLSVDKKLAMMAVLVLGLFVSAPEGYLAQMETILHPTKDYNYDATAGRVEIWKRGIKYMLSHPLTGIGVDDSGRNHCGCCRANQGGELYRRSLERGSQHARASGSGNGHPWIRAHADSDVPRDFRNVSHSPPPAEALEQGKR